MIVCELCTKIGTVRDPIESADASKVATRCRSDACGSYLNKGILVPLMVNFRRTWFAARDDCKSKGGTLVVILNESQQHFLLQMMSSINVYMNVWIGLSVQCHAAKSEHFGSEKSTCTCNNNNQYFIRMG